MIISKHLIVITFLILIVISGLLGFYISSSFKLEVDLKTWKLLYEKQLTESKKGPFSDGKYELPPNDMFVTFLNKYVSEKINFITIDLRTMKLDKYENGIKTKTIDVVSKGKEGSFRETPSGNYPVMQKVGTTFSSVSKVWMPWSVQIYGMYYIHGLPYFPDGRLVTTKYSWGCIRLANEDAKEIFNFVQKGMPILISDAIDPLYTKKPNDLVTNVLVPGVTASSFSIFDFSSNEQILGKDEDDKLPIGYLTKLLTSLVASEVANLEKYVTYEGKRYLALDLLPLMFNDSPKSIQATRSVVSILGEKVIMNNIESRIGSLFLTNTRIVEPIGSSIENISNAVDLTKLMRYLLEKRKIITELSKESDDQVYKNNNEFMGGLSANEKHDSLTAWKLKNQEGEEYVIGISILKSENALADTDKLLNWLKQSYNLAEPLAKVSSE